MSSFDEIHQSTWCRRGYNNFDSALGALITILFAVKNKKTRLAKKSKLDREKEIEMDGERGRSGNKRNGEGKGRDGGQRFLISGALFLVVRFISVSFSWDKRDESRKKEESNKLWKVEIPSLDLNAEFSRVFKNYWVVYHTWLAVYFLQRPLVNHRILAIIFKG